MKIFFFLVSSALFHVVTFGTIVLGSYAFLFSQTSVQKGSGSIEVQIVILGQEGKNTKSCELKVKSYSFKEKKNVDSLEEFLKTQEGHSEKIFSSKPKIQIEEDDLSKELEAEFQTLKGWFPESLIGQKQKNIESHIEKRHIVPLIIPAPKDSGAFQEDSFNIFGNPPPRYPKIAILKGWEGETVARIFVNSEGRVGRIFIAHSSGYSALDKAVFETLQGWQFEKGKTRNIEIPFKFELKNAR